MRIFFAGGSGVIGRRLLPRLVADGHEVTAMTRTPAKAEAIRQAGGDSVVCDALDRFAVHDAVAAARPEAVIHHLTDLTLLAESRRMREAWEANDRVRREGTANLVAAASAAGARRIVAQSIAFAHAPGPGLRVEEDPLFHDAPEPWNRGVAALEELERRVTGTEGLDGLVLRFGFWYGPGTGYARDGSIATLVRKRRYPIVGPGTGVTSFVHVDDVVEATVIGLDGGATGIYNVVDDDPAPLREWLPAYATALGAKRPWRLPAWLVALIAGRPVAYFSTALSGASNQKAKRELGWTPRWPSWRQGFREALG
jgi:nucleoside-diphosphate-sugar epimerase